MRSNNANLSLLFHWIGCNAMFLKIFVILIIQRMIARTIVNSLPAKGRSMFNENNIV